MHQYGTFCSVKSELPRLKLINPALANRFVLTNTEKQNLYPIKIF